MIRAALFLLLCALPAQAQDFRGLLPGMPVSALGEIGEPLDLYRTNNSQRAIYPLPFGHRLMVDYAAEQGLLLLSTFASTDALEAPDSTGLRIGVTTLATAFDRLDLDAAHMTLQGLVHLEPFTPNYFALEYDVEGEVGLVLILTFASDHVPDFSAPPNQWFQIHSASRLHSATLLHRDRLDAFRMPASILSGPRTGPIPFPLPLGEAFPPLIP